MWMINAFLLILLVALFILGQKSSKECIRNIDKKEHRLYIIYPMSEWIINQTGLQKYLNKKSNITDSLKALYLTAKPEVYHKLFWYRRIAQVILVLAICNLLSLFVLLQENSNSFLINGRYLERPDYGDGNTKVEMEVLLENKKDTSAVPREKELTLEVGERIYSKEEMVKLFQESFAYIEKKVLGKNESFAKIDQNLNFITTIPKTSIRVEWQPEDYQLIQSDGTVCNTNLNGTGVTTKVNVILTYYEDQVEESLTFTILPRPRTEQEILEHELANEISEYSKSSAEDKFLELPTSLDNYRLLWEHKKGSESIFLLMLGILLAVLVWIIDEKELNQRMKQRKEQMLLDYPEIINKFTLLVNAGMTIKQAWNRIAEDYSNKSQQQSFQKRYAYEEMLTTAHELSVGIPENTAYDQYGRRTGLMVYMKFASLISQNLKKGTKGFTELLMYEATDAFEERKELAKRLGEEAGTKLLFPMMVMLIIIFIIILIPAFMAFQV